MRRVPQTILLQGALFRAHREGARPKDPIKKMNKRDQRMKSKKSKIAALCKLEMHIM